MATVMIMEPTLYSTQRHPTYLQEHEAKGAARGKSVITIALARQQLEERKRNPCQHRCESHSGGHSGRQALLSVLCAAVTCSRAQMKSQSLMSTRAPATRRAKAQRIESFARLNRHLDASSSRGSSDDFAARFCCLRLPLEGCCVGL